MAVRSILSWVPAAVVFDCDGTLMDTERHWQDARARVLQEFGLTAGPGFAERAKGMHYTECAELMAEEAGRRSLAAGMAERLLAHFTELVSENPVTMPGAVELVHVLGRFAPLAVASNCPYEIVESCLHTADLLDHFAHIVVPGDGVRPKPYPDPYSAATQLCGVAPSGALAIEDSEAGIRSAVGAGLRVLGVGPTPGAEAASLVDLWVTALDEPSLRGWAGDWLPRQRAADTDRDSGNNRSPHSGE
ncbi:HAD family hydrolase [Streptomyces oceani]|uniref:Hydrolase n=1 Tax=Streptomyces oceani TaxID=1075402 RepID=A0A1E7KIZ9_9ACTN|nr:HAD family phosphatase [Streptomyces oceani]OEV03885.1 hydrolase [Streptomyces oceani]